MPPSKISILCRYIHGSDWTSALRLANSFYSLGDHKEPITRAVAAIQNPDFYRAIGKDPQALIDTGIVALQERYANDLAFRAAENMLAAH
jgi:hypothetical protein